METPEFYADNVYVAVHPFTVTLVFGEAVMPVSWDKEQPGQQVAVTIRTLASVRVSPAQAKVLDMILRRSLKELEDKSGAKIAIPPEIMDRLHLSSLEDW